MSASVTVITTERFNDDLREIFSQRTLTQIASSLTSLANFPDMGRLVESPTLTSRFGEGVRSLVCGSYLLIYAHEGDVVRALALYPARLVR